MSCLETLFVLFVVGWLGLMFLMLIRYAIDRTRALNTTLRLSQSMPLTRLDVPKNRHPRMDWYVGTHQGRGFALHLHIFGTSHSGADGVSRSGTSVRLRIVFEVRSQRDFGALHAVGGRRRAKSFEGAFEPQPGSVPPSTDSQEASLFFLRKGYPLGYRDTNVNFTRGSRNLRLVDRSLVEENLVPNSVLPEGKALLVHDHPHPNRTPKQLEQLLEDLNEVARALEAEPSQEPVR